jgi:hypothetical protein
MNENTDISAPALLKFSTEAIEKFLNAREAYERGIADKNTLLPANKKLSGRSIRSSIEPSILEMLCDLEFDRISKEDVSDAELKSFMERRAGNILKKEDATLTSIFHELKLDQTIPDACDRIADLWSQWYAIRKKYQVAEEFATERGRKRWNL